MWRVPLLILIIATVVFGIWLGTRTPSNDRTWLPEQSLLTIVETEDANLTFSNVRDWTYSDTEVLSEEWVTMTVAPEDITRTWLFIDYFAPIHGIAHPFLSFEFSDGRTLVVSVEARREIHEAYSPLDGAFRAYELMYVWSTERDMIARRLVHANNPVSFFPLELSPDESAALFILLVEETNLLANEPRFYNTITGNCMNLLAQLINTLQPNRLPYDFAWNVPGYADEYLIKQGLIESRSRDNADLAAHRAAVGSLATSSPEVFSAQLRLLHTGAN